MKLTLTILCVVGLGTAALAAAPVTLTFIAGSGYIVSQGDFKVAIDALALAEIPAATHALMTAAGSPFDVDLILVTHSDHDHFDPATVSRHMTANPGAMFVAPVDAVCAVQAMAPTVASERLVVVHPSAETPQIVKVAGLTIDVFSFPHPSGGPENVGYRFRLGGLVFVHPGDLNLDTVAADLARTGIEQTPCDVLIVPYYSFGYGYWSRVPGWRARLYVPTHASLYDLRLACTLARGVTENVLCFTSSLETRAIELAPQP
jgi:L-ascorbate metabolism protein UlaG (beta-lactamase superfamily)